MSLGDGLARALRKYMRAKQEQGLLLLLTGGRGIDAAKPKTAGENGTGNGNGNGHGNGHGNGSGTVAKAAPAGEVVPKALPSRFDALGIQWQQTQYKVRCPDCQGELRFSEGCVTCDSCGFSKC
jgi:hypothetical protein